MSTLIHTGDCRVILPTIPDNSIDSIVTDPPYELGFMGKSWDSTGIAYDVTVWQQCLRVLKPGGHIIAFGGSRTYHRLAVAIEDAGFEIRDQIQWIYGSGFPKSLDVSIAMDKQAGVNGNWFVHPKYANRNGNGSDSIFGQTNAREGIRHLYDPATDLAKQWQGWGTALKPAHEPAVLARKPLFGTVADNVTKWSVGAINVDGCRIDANGETYQRTGLTSRLRGYHGIESDDKIFSNPQSPLGRWPANVIFDEEAAQALDGQSGHSVSSQSTRDDMRIRAYSERLKQASGNHRPENTYSDYGGASRFFYVAKVSGSERQSAFYNANGKVNHHPTVKPITLMRYLVRMITPRGGVVLDPFTGSGSTGCAAVIENCSFVGMDITPEYVDIAKKRIEYYSQQLKLDLEV